MARLVLIEGPPCGGKTTEAKRRARMNDIVIDADLLAMALGSNDEHTHPGHTKSLAAKLRDYALLQAKNMPVTVYFVSASPTAQAQILADQVITCDPGIEVCLARASQRPHWTKESINRWYEVRGESKVVRKKSSSRKW